MGLGITKLQKVFGLNARQAAFCLEYLKDLNASAAYKRAGYKPRTDNAARSAAARLLADVRVDAALELLKARRSEKLEISAANVLRELAEISFCQLSDLVEWGPDGVQLKPSDALPEHVKAAVQEVSETQHGLKIRLHHKTRALELLCRHLGIASEKTIQEHSGLIEHHHTVKEVITLPHNARHDEPEETVH